MIYTKFANESRLRCSRNGSCVAPYKPKTTNPPFRPQNHYRPLQMIHKKSIMQRMEQDTSYVLRSTKATDFKISLSAGAKEGEERVSFLEQQIQQAKDSNESSLKYFIEECIALEIQAAKTEESQLIMDLFPAIGKAIKQLQDTDCNTHLQTVNALKMIPTLLQYGPIGNIIKFLHFYQNHHTLDEFPKPTVRTMDTEYATVEERTKVLQHHIASLQRPENSGI